MPEVSIIVPIYNVENYLVKCIESILNQTYTDYELILVNDGSKDKCAEIIEKYASEYENIISIHQKNKGVSAARNAGLKLAQGTYISFIDPDDYVDKEFLKKLVDAMKITNSEISCCNWESFYENGKIKKHIVKEIPSVMSKTEFVKHMFDSPRTIAGSNCNKMFLREKISDFYDETLAICEDNMFLLQYCKNITTACYIDEELYYICERENSAMRKDSRKLLDGLRVRKDMIRVAEGIYKEAGMYAERDYLDLCYAYYVKFDNVVDYEYALKVWHEFVCYIKKHVFHVLVNKKICYKTKCLYLIKIFENELHNFK